MSNRRVVKHHYKVLIATSHLSSSPGPPCVLPNGLKWPPALVQPRITNQAKV